MDELSVKDLTDDSSINFWTRSFFIFPQIVCHISSGVRWRHCVEKSSKMKNNYVQKLMDESSLKSHLLMDAGEFGLCPKFCLQTHIFNQFTYQFSMYLSDKIKQTLGFFFEHIPYLNPQSSIILVVVPWFYGSWSSQKCVNCTKRGASYLYCVDMGMFMYICNGCSYCCSSLVWKKIIESSIRSDSIVGQKTHEIK